MLAAIIGLITGLIKGAPRSGGISSAGFGVNRLLGLASLAGMGWAGLEWLKHHQSVTITLTYPSVLVIFGAGIALALFMEAQRRGPGDPYR